MQWGNNIYMYPIEASLIECYIRQPKPQQIIEAQQFGGVWSQHRDHWRLTWTEDGIRDFYLNNVLIHELGHVLDTRNTNTDDRERYAIWFAMEYGYRESRAALNGCDPHVAVNRLVERASPGWCWPSPGRPLNRYAATSSFSGSQ